MKRFIPRPALTAKEMLRKRRTGSVTPIPVPKRGRGVISEKSYCNIRVGDIVQERELWGNKNFKVLSFHGNDYLLMATALEVGKEMRISNLCNLEVRRLKLISFSPRLLSRLSRKTLTKLVAHGNVEARREMLLRINTKTY